MKLNLNVAINSLGYGVVGYNVWKELHDYDIALWPMANRAEPPVEIDAKALAKIQGDIAKQDLFDGSLPFLKIWHENQLADRIGSGPFTALSFFEVSKFNPRRTSHLKSADRLVVPSTWAANILQEELGLASKVVPMGVDRKVFNEEDAIPSPHSCVFFNCGKWEVRKGHDILASAFKDAFHKGENAELWMMTGNPFLTPSQLASWESKYQGDSRIHLIKRVQYQAELADIMRKINVGVFPARSEGWNLELLELMSMGKEVITTNYSAHTEFCTEANARLITIEEEEPMFDGKWFSNGDGNWASLEGEAYDELVHHLRSSYDSWLTSGTSVNHAGIETAKNLSWKKTAQALFEEAIR